MPKLEHQVLKSTLENPIRIAIIDNDGIGGDIRQRMANQLCKNLNATGIKFAATDRQPPIEIFVEEEDQEKVEASNIKLPTVFDLR